MAGQTCPHTSDRLILPTCGCCPLRVKIAFPKDVFLTSNLRQEYCTALPPVLHWELGTWDLNGGLSTSSKMKSNSHLQALFPSPTRDATNVSQLCKWSGCPDQHCSLLSASKSFGDPCCLVFQSFQVKSTLLMAIQANKSHKNWCSIGWLVCNHRKQQTKQAFPFSRLFLANPAPEPTKVPYNYRTGFIPLLCLNEP